MKSVSYTRTTRLIVALGFAMASGACFAQGDVPAPQAFAQKAALSNIFEIEAAKLALERGKDPSAKMFAADMIADHQQAGIALANAAGQEHVQLPAALDAEHSQKLEALKSSSDKDFDQAYLSTQVTAHEEAVSLFADYAKSSPSGALKSFAEKTLGTLRTHNVRIHGLTKE